MCARFCGRRGCLAVRSRTQCSTSKEAMCGASWIPFNASRVERRLRGIKGGSSPLARSYRGPDNVAGPLLGHLNPALAVVSAATGISRSAVPNLTVANRERSTTNLHWSRFDASLPQVTKASRGHCPPKSPPPGMNLDIAIFTAQAELNSSWT